MEYKQLKKRTFVESGILAGILAVLVSGVLYLDSLSSDYQQQSRSLEGEVSGIMSQIAALRDKYSKVTQNSSLYEEMSTKQKNNQLNIDRDAIRDEFDRFKDRYHLENLHLVVSPVQEMQGAKYKRPSGSIVSSDIDVSFETVSDEEVFALLNAIQHDLPGFSRITKVTLTNPQPLTNEVFNKISQKGSFLVIKGDLQFTWLGIKAEGAADNNANAQKKKP